MIREGKMSYGYVEDYGTGFSSVAASMTHLLGIPFRFGYAGGCVNMLGRLETGHRINITDLDSCLLTPMDRREMKGSLDVPGYWVCLCTLEGFENGHAPIIERRSNFGFWHLPVMVQEVLDELVGRNSGSSGG